MEQIREYLEFTERFAGAKLPKQPVNWNYASGWTRYDAAGEMTIVDYPEEDIFVFDVETVVREGSYPAMAVAASENYWCVFVKRSFIHTPFTLKF